MKYLIIALVLVMIAYLVSNKGKICVNTERTGVMFLRGGYRAYWIRYSHGLKYPYHPFIDNVWCWPHFEWCDVRKLTTENER